MGMPGYVYALINPSIPGLVKVGRTERDPASRAAELSGVTGVATPFIVVFHEHFHDCHAAEDYVHAILEHQGKRTSKNKEFFEADISEVIKIIVKARDEIDPSEPEVLDELIPYSIQDELSEFTLVRTNPAEELLSEGVSHRWGMGDFIQDLQEAMRCFTQAAKLGNLDALIAIGEMHEDGQGVRQDTDKALTFYKEAARKGNFVGLSMMANLFDPIHRQNADKLWRLFFSKWAEASKGNKSLCFSEWNSPVTAALKFLRRPFDGSTTRFHYSEDMAVCVEMVRAHRDDMLTWIDLMLADQKKKPEKDWDAYSHNLYEFRKSVREWVVAA